MLHDGYKLLLQKNEKKKKHIEKAKTTRTSHKQRKVACMPITHLNLSLSLCPTSQRHWSNQIQAKNQTSHLQKQKTKKTLIPCDFKHKPPKLNIF